VTELDLTKFKIKLLNIKDVNVYANFKSNGSRQ